VKLTANQAMQGGHRQIISRSCMLSVRVAFGLPAHRIVGVVMSPPFLVGRGLESRKPEDCRRGLPRLCRAGETAP
jgi:hypothetical protein